MILIKLFHRLSSRRSNTHLRKVGLSPLLPSSFQCLLIVLIAAATLPSSCLADEHNETDGGGGAIPPPALPIPPKQDGDANHDVPAVPVPTPIGLYQNESYQIGSVTVVGTSFNSSVNSSDVWLKVPGVFCGVEGDRTEQCGAKPAVHHPVRCCSGFVCESGGLSCTASDETVTAEPTADPTADPTSEPSAGAPTTDPVDASKNALAIMFIGDSGGTNGERAASYDDWVRLVDVGEKEKEPMDLNVNLKVQYKYYVNNNNPFLEVWDGINKFVVLSSILGVDRKDPIVDFRAKRFSAPPPPDDTNGDVTPPSLALVAPSVHTVDGGAVLVMFLLDSDAGGPIITGIDTPTGFKVLSSDVSLSGESMSAFVSSAVPGGGCIDPEPVAQDFTTRSSGIVMSLSLRPLGGAVEDFFPPCDKEELTRWNATRNMERDALARFYKETGGPDEENGWERRGGWLQPGIDHCKWEGVGCDVSGLATSLTLTSNGLKGSLPSFNDLQNMVRVDLTNNNIGGEFDIEAIPASMAYINISKNELKALLGEIPASLRHLDLSENDLAGTCCKAVSQNSNFTRLNIAENNLEAVDVSTATSLQYLDLSHNKQLNQRLSDIGLGNLYNLTTLKLSNSPGRLTGDLNLGNQSLTYLDLHGLKLEGNIEPTGIADMVNLTHLDLSGGNFFRGYLNFCKFTGLEVLNLEGNNLFADITGAGCQNLRFIRYINLRGNGYKGHLSSIAQQSELEYIDFSHNQFYGTLPTDGQLGQLRWLDISYNSFTGPLPSFAGTQLRYMNLASNALHGTISSSIGDDLPIMQSIDLSNQLSSIYYPSTGERVTSGLSGQIPESIGRMRFLQTLNMSYNILSGTLPETLAGLVYLKTIDLEENRIGGSMPATVNVLEQLKEVLLANNRLKGDIPALSGARDVIRTVTLRGNPDLNSPAPFTLCDLDDLDLRKNNMYCPTERSALAKLYQETQGSEWINNGKWLTEASHCEWEGVECSEDKTKVLKLSLVLNGVSGELPEEFFKLTHLEHLDLNDNELRGTISSSLGNMKSLKYLRLSYNIFTGPLPKEISQLKNLSLIHLHGNRLTGDDSDVTLVPTPQDPHAEEPQFYFITDCGDPQDALSEFVCEGCDMCCNSLEECNDTTFTAKRNPYANATIVILCSIAAMAALWVITRLLVKTNIVKLSNEGSNAFEAAGDDSVYSFFLSSRKLGWLLTVITLLIQAAIFILFLEGADFANGDGDFVYSWRCPRNVDNCADERAVGTYGWIMWGFLVFASLLDDLANGVKLLLLSSNRGSIPCFICGLTLISITVLAIYTSYFYNRAIAMTNTELIVNAVILLFVNDVDEQVFSIAKILNSKWLDGIIDEAQKYSTELLEYNVSDDNAAAAADDVGSEKADEEFFFSAKFDHGLAAPLVQSDNGSDSNHDGGAEDLAQDQGDTFWSRWFGPKENHADVQKSIATSSTGGVDVASQSYIELAREVALLKKQMAEMKQKMQ